MAQLEHGPEGQTVIGIPRKTVCCVLLLAFMVWWWPSWSRADAWGDFEQGVAAELVGNTSQAEQFFDRAIASGELQRDRLAAVFRARAHVRQSMHNIEGALEDLDSALAIVPDSVLTLLARAEVLKRMGRFSQALADVEQVLALEPGNAAALVHKGLILQRMGRDTEALDAANSSAQAATEEEQRREAEQRAESTSWDINEEYQEGMAYYEQLVRDHPEDPLAWVERGTAMAERGRHDKALEDFDRALSIDPNHVGALYNRGMAYYREGRIDEARRDWQRVRELDPAIETPDFNESE